MTATATTTRPAIGGPTSANTSKHAFAPFCPRNSTAANVTLPAQRHNLDLWPVGLASGTSRHDFYVSVRAGSQTAVLVHNCGWPRPTDSNCEACARQIQSKIGGEIVRITPLDDPVLGESTNNPAGNWGFHDVVSSGGRVYDGFTGPDGLSPDEFKSQFIHADGIDFGGL